MAKRTLMLLGLLLLPLVGCTQEPDFWIGANVKIAGDATWDSAAAKQSLQDLADSGADRGLLVAFTWQADPASNEPVIGSDSSPEMVRAGLVQMKQVGLVPVLKIHLWIPEHWAGEAQPTDVDLWFDAYRDAVLPLARVAEQEQVPALVVATELRNLEQADNWAALVAAVREVYSGKVLYVADSLQRAEEFPHWGLFDAIGSSLYPSLPSEPMQRDTQMREAAQRLLTLGERHQKPVWVAEVGLRSADDVLSAPWESPEQRELPVDLELQKTILEKWKSVLNQPGIAGMGIWCWYTNPDAGGENDTDFTVQNKPAETIFRERPATQPAGATGG